MSDAVTIRTRKVISNPLLARRQFVIDVLHPNRANVSKDELRDKLAEIYKAEKDAVSVFGSEPNLVVASLLVSVWSTNPLLTPRSLNQPTDWLDTVWLKRSKRLPDNKESKRRTETRRSLVPKEELKKSRQKKCRLRCIVRKTNPVKETEDDLLDRLEKEEEEDKKFKELQEKRKKNPFWKEQSMGMENLEKRLQEQQKHQMLNEQLEAIQTRVDRADKDKLEDLAREKLQAKPPAKRKLDIPTTIKLKKKPKLLVDYSSDSD
ncbi:hypothetical protein Cantr_04853 [Candida viswanathii]|uniref:Uncharacterized protein n=1 Tax=Candida viswanathii TaxID=5486 RepID=A0A367XPS6_9ASCO|nr:hypothetical protein Cantr_04853 [Candida viswanathii]